MIGLLCASPKKIVHFLFSEPYADQYGAARTLS